MFDFCSTICALTFTVFAVDGSVRSTSTEAFSAELTCPTAPAHDGTALESEEDFDASLPSSAVMMKPLKSLAPPEGAASVKVTVSPGAKVPAVTVSV